MAAQRGQQLGNYRLIQLLGQGGFAEVYLGEHVRLGMKAAIKVLHTHLAGEEAISFQQEARIISDLKHPHIIRVLDFDVQSGQPFLVLDFAPNGSLRHKHPRGTRLPFPLVVEYVTQIAGALQHAHDRQLIHRDIKPENMLVGDRGEILLSDFGIATIAHSTSSMSTQASIGTLAYMPPEQIQGKPRKESDQYALAVTVYQWLTGDLPFQGSSTEMIAQHLMVPAPSLCSRVPGLPVEVEQIVLKALAKDPKERHESVQAFADALAALRPAGAASTQPAGFAPTRPAAPPGNAWQQTMPRPGVSPTVPAPPSSSWGASLSHQGQAVPFPPRSATRPSQHRKLALGVLCALTLVLLIAGAWPVMALTLPPSYQSLTQPLPLSTYTLQDEKSRQIWPTSGVSGCSLASGGYQVEGSGSGDHLTRCSGYIGQPTGNMLVQVTILIKLGQCGGFEINTGAIEICADGQYEADSFIGPLSSQQAQVLHTGLNAVNVVAFSVTNDGNENIQTTYINGQQVDRQYIDATDDPSQAPFRFTHNQVPGYLTFVSDVNSTV
ncbi:MAG: protein kinase, partial [Ktedonobacteraceae bacterium]|nr:protein kinase [Ktedonobacteraceae bacterium]